MYLLQEKVNSYIGFIESGEIFTTYPKARGKKIIVRVVAKHEMNDGGKDFFKKI
jgi:hypothetical protein